MDMSNKSSNSLWLYTFKFQTKSWVVCTVTGAQIWWCWVLSSLLGVNNLWLHTHLVESYNSHATADQNFSRFFSRASPASSPPNSSSLQQCGDKAPRNPLQQRKHTWQICATKWLMETASAFWGCIWYFTNLEILKEGEIPTQIIFGCDSARCVTTICPNPPETGQNLWLIIHPSSRRHEHSSVSTSAKLGLAILASKLAKAEGTSTTLSSSRTQNESKVVAKCRLDCNRYSWWQVLYGEAGSWIKNCFDNAWCVPTQHPNHP